MLIDGPKIREGSEITNLTIKSGTLAQRNALPQPSTGEMFFVVGVPEPFMSFYSGSAWVTVAGGFSGGDFNSHVSNELLHLSAAENADLAQLVGVTSPVQGQFDALSADLSSHVSDADIHVTPQQDALLNGITASAEDINRTSTLPTDLASKLNRAGDIMNAGANLVFSGGTVTGIPFPQMDSDVANKAYVDAHASGIDWKESVVAATTGPITLSGEQIIDDIPVFTGDRVLVKNQPTDTANGIYIADASAWTRAPDYNTAVKISQSAVYVQNGGTLNGGGSFIQPAVIETFPGEPILFTAFSGPAINNAGAGIDLAVNGTVSVKNARGLVFDGANALEVSVFPGHLILTTDGASSTSAQNAVIGLADTGVIPSTYKSVTVDEKGRVVGGTNPTTLAGYGITDAQALNITLTSLSNLATNGLIVKSGSGVVSRSIAVEGSGLAISNPTGVTGNPTISIDSTELASPETIVYRDATGSFSTLNVATGSTRYVHAGQTVAEEAAFKVDIPSPTGVPIDVLPISAVRSAKYLYQLERAPNEVQMGEFIIIHDGISAYFSEVSRVDPLSMLGTFAVSISGSDMVLIMSTGVDAPVTLTLRRTLMFVS